MDHWEKFNATLLPRKENFYNNLNMEDITAADDVHAKRVCKDFEIKGFGEYHDIFVQSYTLLLADVLEICVLKYMILILQNFFQLQDQHGKSFKKKKQIAKANSKYMKDYDENKKLSQIQYWNVNNLYGQAMMQKFLISNFEWIKDSSKFNKDVP